MFKNYLKIALRNLAKNRIYTSINILGLAIGITCCLLIVMFVRHELSFDQFHSKSSRIFRVAQKRTLEGSYEETPRLSLAAMELLINDFHEIEMGARILREFSPVLEHEENQFIEENFFFVDPAILDIFDFEFIRGNPKTALQAFNNVIITEEIARKYFGGIDPIGKNLTYRKWGQTLEFAVTGVIRSFPKNSHFHMDFLTPFESEQNLWDAMHGNDWYYTGSWNYLLLRESESARSLESKLDNFVQRHYPEDLKGATQLSLQPLTNIHLHSHLDNELENNGKMTHIYVFSAIAALVLLIACINFMNLATARSAYRAKEVGLRKVIGAFRSDLIWQFLGEAMILSFCSLLLSIGLVELSLPWFNNIIGRTVAVDYLGDPFVIPVLISLGLFVGLLAGSYPAFYLSAFLPVKVLKGTAGTSGYVPLRKILVVGQFVVSMILLVGIAIISDQVDFMLNKDLGFNSEEIVFVKSQPAVNFDALKNELSSGSDIVEVIGGWSVPVSENASTINWQLFRPEEADKNRRLQMASTFIDYDYARMFSLKIVDGRYFSEEFTSDPAEAVIINETAANEFGWLENIVGRQIEVFNMVGASTGMRRVIGVVKDFHFESLHDPIKPLVLSTNGRGRYGNFIMRIKTENLSNTLSFIEDKWQAVAPQFPLQLYFLNDDLNHLYQQEVKLNQIIKIFSVLAILISCLGLFGLSAFSAERRTKEIGIRKVVGASIVGVVMLLIKEFVKLVAVAFVIAAPLGFIIMNRWLQEFAYRIDIAPSTFLFAGAVAVLVALITVSYQAIKAALANPVEALRYE